MHVCDKGMYEKHFPVTVYNISEKTGSKMYKELEERNLSTHPKCTRSFLCINFTDLFVVEYALKTPINGATQMCSMLSVDVPV